jgi:hypothetical protein
VGAYATAAATLKLHPHTLLVKTFKDAKVNTMFTNSFTHICLHEIMQIHAFVVYDICSGLDTIVHGTSIGLF